MFTLHTFDCICNNYSACLEAGAGGEHHMFWFASSLIRINLPSPPAFNLLTVDGCLCLQYISREVMWDMCQFSVHSLSRLDLWFNALQNVLPNTQRPADWEPNHTSKDKRLWAGPGWWRGFFWHCVALCENMITEIDVKKHVLLKSVFLEMIPLIIALQKHDVSYLYIQSMFHPVLSQSHHVIL